MSKLNYDRNANRSTFGGPMPEGVTITKRTAVFAFTDAQRKAVQKFRNAARDEDTATKALAVAVMQESIACAQMFNAGLTIKRISEITHRNTERVRRLIDQGQALIEDIK